MDRGDSEVKYTLSGEGAGPIFTIDQTTGDIHALVSLDREEKSYYTLRAQAVDLLSGRSEHKLDTQNSQTMQDMFSPKALCVFF